MADVRIPAELHAAIEALSLPVRDRRQRAAALSTAYRAMRPSASAVAGQSDIAAYLTTRMPATFAAVATVLEAACDRLPDFAPRTLLDAGAGPGTASWAAGDAFSTLETITLVDHNSGLLEVAGALAAASARQPLATAERLVGTLTRLPVDDRRFDLVLASYALTEVADSDIDDVVRGLWDCCTGVLVIVEPGRPRDYLRLMAGRAALIAAGARVIAPCPHDRPCPLPTGDWCHFSARLPRSRAHRQAKGGALGYEDEKFSYLVVARPQVPGVAASVRVIGPPVVRKFEVEAPACTVAGLSRHVVRKQDAAAFKSAKKLAWGDSLE